MKKFTFTVVALSLAITGFAQTKHYAKSQREAGVSYFENNITHAKLNSVLSEGFETFLFPNSINGWTRIQSNITATWDTSLYQPYSGIRAVGCEYDPNLAQQDEWLITPALNFTGANGVTVNFAWNGSKYWSVDPYDNCDLNLKYSTDGGTNWSAVVWSEETDTVGFGQFVWQTESINVNAVAGQSNVKFAFQYLGNDGAEFVVDEVNVDAQGGSGAVNIPLTPFFINIYPNPVGDILTIESSGKVDYVKIFDNLGQLILNKNELNETETIDVSGLSEGLYYIEFSGGNGKTTKKIIINR